MTPGQRDVPRLAIVLSHPTQYYSPWFRWMRAHTTLTFRVFYLSEFGLKPALDEKFKATFAWDVDLTTGYDWEFVPNLARVPDTLRFSGLHNPQLPERLERWKPDAILVFGYNYRTHVRLIAWARGRGIPLIFRGDSHLLGRVRLPLLKRAVLKLLYRQFSAVTFVGESNRAYFRYLGVPEKKLFFAPHAVNAEHFDSGNTHHHEAAEQLRSELGVGRETRVVLFAGKLIPSKQPLALLKAFAELGVKNTALVIVGQGPELEAMQAWTAQHPEATVRFLPFANQSEMPARYAMADLFVLPSIGPYETWGLAVNEAMHLGVPCLVSDQVGSQRDLVTDGETGWVFRADTPSALRDKLGVALDALEKEPDRFGPAARERIQNYTYKQAAEGLIAAFSSVLTCCPPFELSGNLQR
jgi:glycosyltransferase involved in cell wall biosynthesis